jgi:hypothetical protein
MQIVQPLIVSCHICMEHLTGIANVKYVSSPCFTLPPGNVHTCKAGKFDSVEEVRSFVKDNINRLYVFPANFDTRIYNQQTTERALLIGIVQELIPESTSVEFVLRYALV